MSDLYLEELVKRRKTGTDQALRYVLMALTAIGVVLSLLTWNLIIIAVSIAICVADIFIFPRFQTEWEYQPVRRSYEFTCTHIFSAGHTDDPSGYPSERKHCLFSVSNGIYQSTGAGGNG